MPKKSVKKKKPAKKPARKSVKKAKKKAKKPTRARKAAPRKTAAKTEKPIGTVTHFYGHIKVAVVKFSKPPKLGAEVRFKGATTDFRQTLASAQYDHKPLKTIPKAKQVGVKVRSRVRAGDKVISLS